MRHLQWSKHRDVSATTSAKNREGQKATEETLESFEGRRNRATTLGAVLGVDWGFRMNL